MRYQVTTSSGEKYFISLEEAKNIAVGEMKGLVFVPSIHGYLNLSFVLSVVPESQIDRTKMKTGFLHDGTQVVKRFGEWKYALHPELELEADYYPEILSDQIMTEEEVAEYLQMKTNLLEDKTTEILHCQLCGGDGWRNFFGKKDHTPIERMCVCVQKELQTRMDTQRQKLNNDPLKKITA